MKNQKHKWYALILYALFLILLIPFSLIGTLIAVAWFAMLPLLERSIYARSAYFAVSGEKYSFMITRTKRYRICRTVARKRPDLAFVHTEHGDVIVTPDALIFFDVFDRVIFNERSGRWFAALAESEEPTDLAEWFTHARTALPVELTSGKECRLLALEQIFYRENLQRAKESPLFLLYNREWKLNRLVKSI